MADTKTKVDVRPRIAPKLDLKEPSNYNVIYINDEVTTMEFVVESLRSVFNYATESAEALTLQVHAEGSAVVATLPYEMAEQKGIEVTLLARNNGFPLQVKIESES
jgi:ATP-dependent Clp protease adaptor protein ClpS